MSVNIIVQQDKKLNKDNLIMIVNASQAEEIKAILIKAMKVAETEKDRIGLDWIYSLFNPLEL